MKFILLVLVAMFTTELSAVERWQDALDLRSVNKDVVDYWVPVKKLIPAGSSREVQRRTMASQDQRRFRTSNLGPPSSHPSDLFRTDDMRSRKTAVGCVIFSYVISSAGRARNIKLMHARPTNRYIDEGRSHIEAYRWVASPTNIDKQAVKSSMVISFGTEDQSACIAAKRGHQNKPIKPKTCEAKSGSRLLSSCS